MNWLNDINNLKLPQLKSGAHSSPEDGVCAMEMVSYIERLPHSDSPECTCPVIAAFVRRVNDGFDNEYRQKLLIRLPGLVNTVSKEHEQERGEFLAWKAINLFAPIALRAAGLNENADKLETFKDNLGEAAGASMDAAEAAWASRVAGFAAEAAWAAAEAAWASRASRAATWAAKAATEASRAATWAVVPNNLILQTLDELLEIGPKGNWTNYETERAKELELIGS